MAVLSGFPKLGKDGNLRWPKDKPTPADIILDGLKKAHSKKPKVTHRKGDRIVFCSIPVFDRSATCPQCYDRNICNEYKGDKNAKGS